MDEYTDLMPAADLAHGEMTGVKVGSHLYLVANVGGQYHVADGRCPHLLGNLTKGTLDGTVVECPLHGSRFDLVDGSVVRWTSWSGAVLSVASAVRHPRGLTVYECEVRDGRVFAGPARATP